MSVMPTHDPTPDPASPGAGPDAGPAAELDRIPAERSQLKHLLALNPNYFGTLVGSELPPVMQLAGNTTYEELTCVGYDPRTAILEATVSVKQSGGYDGGLCGPGSYEYVRFYLDYGDGWQDAGVASINVHDLPAGVDCAGNPWSPLSYAASLQITPWTSPCFTARLPRVRAILSWKTTPDNPDFLPVWGNVLEDTIQIKPRFWFLNEYVDVLAGLNQVKIQILDDYAWAEQVVIPKPDPGPLALAELAKVYGQSQGAKAKAGGEVAVPSHRFGFAHLQKYLQGSPVSEQAFSAKVSEWKSVGLDWTDAIQALMEGAGDVDYEELECLGLDSTLDRVEATFRVKRPTGYSGTLCQTGSTEYVAFWATFGDDYTWTYLGTADVQVHDIATVPADGISYAAALPVDLTHQRRDCSTPRVVRLRAVLSWSSAPSTTDPDDVPYWGNRIDRHVQIAPGLELPPGTVSPLISILGGIPVQQIDGSTGLTTPTAHFSLLGGSAPADPNGFGRPCPFARVVAVQGPAFVGYTYRVQVREVGSASWQTLNQNFTLTDQYGGTSTQSAVGDYYPYVPNTVNQDNLLAVWSTVDDTLWEVKLDIAGVPGTDQHRAQLHNSQPVADIHINPLAGDCSKHAVGTLLDGTYVATDPYLSSYALGTLPYAAPAGHLTPEGAVYLATPAGGSGWTLNTSDMKPCGYVLQLGVSSRAIYNSSPSYTGASASVGFCLDAPA